MTSFRVATNRRWRAQDGTTQEKTVWFGVSVWERQAEACNQYLTKGQRVLVVGDIEEPRIYTDREGNTRASLDVRARNVEFLTSRAEAQGLTPGPDQPAEEGEGRGHAVLVHRGRPARGGGKRDALEAHMTIC